MTIASFQDLNTRQLDTLREVGSIGMGNAATALSQILGKEVRVSLPKVRIMECNEAIRWIGGPEIVTAGVLVQLSGKINGLMLSVQQLEFANLILESIHCKTVSEYSELTEIQLSALTEVGNILISTFIRALSDLLNASINLTVPAFTVDMQGAILAVPMAEYGCTSDYLMTIGADFICNQKQVPCRLLLSPSVQSLNLLLKQPEIQNG